MADWRLFEDELIGLSSAFGLDVGQWGEWSVGFQLSSWADTGSGYWDGQDWGRSRWRMGPRPSVWPGMLGCPWGSQGEVSCTQLQTSRKRSSWRETFGSFKSYGTGSLQGKEGGSWREEGSGLRSGRERGAMIEREGNPRRRGRSDVW